MQTEVWLMLLYTEGTPNVSDTFNREVYQIHERHQIGLFQFERVVKLVGLAYTIWHKCMCSWQKSLKKAALGWFFGPCSLVIFCDASVYEYEF